MCGAPVVHSEQLPTIVPPNPEQTLAVKSVRHAPLTQHTTRGSGVVVLVVVVTQPQIVQSHVAGGAQEGLEPKALGQEQSEYGQGQGVVAVVVLVVVVVVLEGHGLLRQLTLA